MLHFLVCGCIYTSDIHPGQCREKEREGDAPDVIMSVMLAHILVRAVLFLDRSFTLFT